MDYLVGKEVATELVKIQRGLNDGGYSSYILGVMISRLVPLRVL